METASYVRFDAIFGRSISKTQLAKRLGQLSLEDCLQSAGKLSFLLTEDRRDDADAFVMEVFRSDPTVLARLQTAILQGDKIVFTQRLLALARYALVYADPNRPPGDFSQQPQKLRLFAEALLGAGDLADQDGQSMQMARTTEERREWLLSWRLRRMGMPHRTPRNSIPRTFRVYVDLPRRRPELLTAGPIDADFTNQVGLSLTRYLAMALGVAQRFSFWSQEPDTWVLGDPYWQNTTITPQEFARATGKIAIALSDMQRLMRQQVRDGAGLDDVRPFVLHPLIEIDPGRFLAVHVEALTDAMLGDGLFWRLKPDPAASAQQKRDFGEVLGHLLEEHCVEVAQSVYPAPTRGAAPLFREIHYAGGDGPDLAVFDREAIAFVEIGSDRPDMVKTVGLGNLASFDADVDRIILKRARQLSRKIDDYRSGRLTYTGHLPQGNETVYPVICLADGFPLGGTPGIAGGPVPVSLYQRILDRVAQVGCLLQPGVAPVTIISVEELEHLCACVEQGTELTQLLADRFASPYRDEPFVHYFVATQGTTPDLPHLLQRDFDAATRELAQQLFP
jgi:hypothetical protein